MTSMEQSEYMSNGFAFLPNQDPHALGHLRLDIRMSNTPSNVNFNPKEVQLSILTSVDRSHPNRLEHLTAYHPWTNQRSFRVVPGLVMIINHEGEKMEAFTFGGTLEIATGETYTDCVIESPAPIFWLETSSHLIKTLIEEVEILLAHRRAEWGQEQEKYEARLAAIPVMTFYIACLQHILTSLEHSPRRDVLDIQDLILLIEQEQRRLKKAGLLPEEIPSIQEIL